jgi:hypothetical protein
MKVRGAIAAAEAGLEDCMDRLAARSKVSQLCI